MAAIKRGLGRGLSALIPDADMDFLSRVARGVAITDAPASQPLKEKNPTIKRVAPRDAVGKSGLRVQKEPVESIQEPVQSEEAQGSSGAATVESVPVQWVDVGQIEANPFQPRRTFSPQEMQELVDSIREHGILQPVLVRPVGGTENPASAARFQLVAGERRWRAARAAGLQRVPAVVREVEDQQALELALIENVQRHDISPLDAAVAYKRLASEFKLSQEHIARRVGKSRSAVANTLRLLDLPSEVQHALEDGTLSEGHGRAILLAGGEGARRAVFRRIVRDRLSVRDAEHLARGAIESNASQEIQSRAASFVDGKDVSNASASTSASNHSQTNARDLAALQRELEKRVGARLSIKARARGGQIIIQYNDENDLTRLLELFRQPS